MSDDDLPLPCNIAGDPSKWRFRLEDIHKAIKEERKEIRDIVEESMANWCRCKDIEDCIICMSHKELLLAIIEREKY